MMLWPQIVDYRVFPWRFCPNSERRTAWESAYYDVPLEFFDLQEAEPNQYPWKWRQYRPGTHPRPPKLNAGEVSGETGTHGRVEKIKGSGGLKK